MRSTTKKQSPLSASNAKRLEDRLEGALFEEYWGESVPKADRIEKWLLRADQSASDWIPSASLFLDYQRARPGFLCTLNPEEILSKQVP